MPGDNRLVTESFLATNFTPDSGITPGSDNLLNMDCSQVQNRYNVSIAGITSTGLRCPSQNQISGTAPTPPMYDYQSFSYLSVASSTLPPYATTTTFNLNIFYIFYNYIGSAYKYLVIESFTNNADGDSYDFTKLRYNGVDVSTYPFSIDISGLSSSSLTGLSVYANDQTGVLFLDIPSQYVRITFHVEDINGLSGATRTIYRGIKWDMPK